MGDVTLVMVCLSSIPSGVEGVAGKCWVVG